MKKLAVLLLTTATTAHAEDEPAAGRFRPRDLSVAVNAGLIQPLLLGGANAEVDVRYGPLVFAYSHGMSLDFEGSAITGEMKRQNVTLHAPYSTGFGVGVTHWFEGLRSFVDLRLEGKIHRFEASYEASDVSTEFARYTTYTLGGGAYWTYLPFASRRDALRGIDISTSLRFWPKIASTKDEVTYANASTGRTETHEAANIGIANTPLLANVSIGYVFQ